MYPAMATVVSLFIALPLAAADQPKEMALTPAEKYKALVKQYDDAMKAFSTAYQAAKTDEEKQKVFKEKYPNGEKLGPRFLDLADKYPKDPTAFDALVWVVTHSLGSQAKKDSPQAKALDRLARDHAGSEKLGRVCKELAALRAGAGSAGRRRYKANVAAPVRACRTLP